MRPMAHSSSAAPLEPLLQRCLDDGGLTEPVFHEAAAHVLTLDPELHEAITKLLRLTTVH